MENLLICRHFVYNSMFECKIVYIIYEMKHVAILKIAANQKVLHISRKTAYLTHSIFKQCVLNTININSYIQNNQITTLILTPNIYRKLCHKTILMNIYL